jgi:hypothetical protein
VAIPKTSFPKFRLVYVEWEDHAGQDGWMPLSEARRASVHPCASIGWLIGENETHIMLAASFTLDEDRPEPDVAGHMTINRKLIHRMRTVALK